LYHINHIQDCLNRDDLWDKPAWVTINEIDEAGQAKLIEEAQKVLRANKNFLPIVIDSYGGEVYSALGMYDIIRSFDCEVLTVVIGKAMSAGALLFSAGDYRYISENSTIMIHQVSSVAYGKEEELRQEAEEVTRLNDHLFGMLDKRCKKKKGYWKKLLKDNEYTDLYLTGQDAVEHGLASEIGLPNIRAEAPDIRRTWIKD